MQQQALHESNKDRANTHNGERRVAHANFVLRFDADHYFISLVDPETGRLQHESNR